MGGVTVAANSMSVVHKSSGGISMSFPDVCLTPAPPAPPIPIPYPNIAMSADTDKGSKKVKMDGNPIMLKNSNFSKSTGDKAGTNKGVVSGQNMGKAYPMMFSFDVKVEGQNVFRMLDTMLQNGASPTNTPPATELQGPVCAMPDTVPPPEITSVEWSTDECGCGDAVEIAVQTSNFDDGDVVTVSVTRDDGVEVASFSAEVVGDEAFIYWLVRTGPNTRGDVELALEATGAGDPVAGGADLCVNVPDEAVQAGSKLRRTIPQMTQVPDPAGGASTWVAAGGNWGWDYGFELEIKEGVFHITGKIKLVGQRGLTVRDKHKRRWKREIEGIWTRKWKEHRENCRRGAGCNCQGGCCLFPIEVHCEFVSSGEYAEVEVWRGSPDTYGRPGGRHAKWWTSGTWFMDRCGHEGNGSAVRAHEFGHEIGLYDEYATGAVWVPTNAAGASTGPPPRSNVPGSLMCDGRTINENHLDEFHTWFLDQAPDNFLRVRM